MFFQVFHQFVSFISEHLDIFHAKPNTLIKSEEGIGWKPFGLRVIDLERGSLFVRRESNIGTSRESSFSAQSF